MRPFSLLFLAAALAVLGAPPVHPVHAQQPAPADSVDSRSPLTDSLQAALTQFEAAQPPTPADSAALRRWADSVQATGMPLRGRQPARARNLLQEALRARRALADTTQQATIVGDIGVTYYFQSQYENALAQYKQSLRLSRAAGNRAEVAATLNNLAVIHRNQGRYEEALARYREALTLHRALGNQAHVAPTLENVGLVHRDRGRYEKALARYREALALYREQGDRAGIAGVQNNIGLVYQEQGQYSEALRHYRTALALNRELGNRRNAALVLNNLGIIRQKQERYEKALEYYRESLALDRELGNQRGIALTLNNIGLVRRAQGRYEQALARHREALSHWQEMGNRKGAARVLANVGRVYEEQGHGAKALRKYRQALQMNREIGNRPETVRALHQIGSVHLTAGRLAAATDTLTEAVRLAEELRQNATSPEARRSLLSTQIGAYRALTTTHLRAGRPDSALRSVEQARARLLADRLYRASGGGTTMSVPPARRLRRTLDAGEAALLYANAGTERPLTALVVTPDTTTAHPLPDSSVRAGIKQAYATQLTRLRRTAGPLTAALAPHTRTSGPLPSLAEIIRLYRRHLTRTDTDPAIRSDLAQRLHRLLVAPIAEQVQEREELIVVPTGALGFLPIETLRAPTGQYLVEHTPVRYIQSLTVLQWLQVRDHPERARSLLAVGGAAYTPEKTSGSGMLVAEARRGSTRVTSAAQASTLLRSAERRLEHGRSPRPTYAQLGYRTWVELPGTKTEVKRLARLAGPDATVLTGPEAAEPTLRSLSDEGRLDDYRRLHFATHGVAVPEAPKLSALVLSQVDASDSLAARDGYLTMEEIAGLEMRADVAVLSACQTGLGKVVAGEGVVSLSHAFLRAGANATLVSQWKVLDKSTRQFMTAVYEKAKGEDTSFAEAVTETKRAFIAGEHGEKNTDPLRWAPFVYYGRE